MTIIIIASDTYETGRRVAEKTAAALECPLVGREVFADVAKRDDINQEKVQDILASPKSPFFLSQKIRTRILTDLQAETLARLVKRPAVCHGVFAHLYVQGVSHVIKVKVYSGKSESKPALSWPEKALGVDDGDPAQYDLVISLSSIEEDQAVNLIAETAGYRKFQAMTYSIACLDDLLAAARARSRLLARFPEAMTLAQGGKLTVYIRLPRREKIKRASIVKDIIVGIPEVSHVEVRALKEYRQALEDNRKTPPDMGREDSQPGLSLAAKHPV